MIVSLVTDYGTEDDFAGICHGVIASIAPDARIIDVTHGIPRFDVRRGAIVLHDALPYLPVGVHVAVVDPQVGTWLFAAFLVLVAVIVLSRGRRRAPQSDASEGEVADPAAVRQPFEARWVRWNAVRSVLSVAAFACLLAAVVVDARAA